MTTILITPVVISCVIALCAIACWAVFAADAQTNFLEGLAKPSYEPIAIPVKSQLDNLDGYTARKRYRR